MAIFTICSDFGAQENKFCHCFHFCYNKVVILGTLLSWILWVPLENYWIQGDNGNLPMFSLLGRSVNVAGTYKFVAGFWSEGICVEDYVGSCR